MIWVGFGALQSITKVFISIGYLLSMYLLCIGYVLCMLYVCSCYVLLIISSCSEEDEGRGERHPLSIQRWEEAGNGIALLRNKKDRQLSHIAISGRSDFCIRFLCPVWQTRVRCLIYKNYVFLNIRVQCLVYKNPVISIQEFGAWYKRVQQLVYKNSVLDIFQYRFDVFLVSPVAFIIPCCHQRFFPYFVIGRIFLCSRPSE